MDYEVCWHMAAWLDVLDLRPSREIPQADLAAAIERRAMGLGAWEERDADQVGDMPWAWVFPQGHLFDVLLPEGKEWGFRDLRLFCLA
jgi:hypothetical protein